MLAEWDPPYTVPIITEVAGVIHYGDIAEGVTMEEQVDEVTGLSRKVVIEAKSAEKRPRITLKGEDGKTVKLPNGAQARYMLPVGGANISVEEGTPIHAGAILAKIPRETTKTKDITGGLPRVAELFEARKPKEVAVISEIDGVVSLVKIPKGNVRLLSLRKLVNLQNISSLKGSTFQFMRVIICMLGGKSLLMVPVIRMTS